MSKEGEEEEEEEGEEEEGEGEGGQPKIWKRIRLYDRDFPWV